MLLAHVLAALVGLGAVVLAGGYAGALLRAGAGSEAVRRYYRPGVNWAGRVLFLIPVLGFALVAMSRGDWSLSDGWITIGLALWAAVAVVAEMVLWPAERRLQVAVEVAGAAVAAPAPPSAGPAAGSTVGPAADRLGPALAGAGGHPVGPDLRSECLRVIGMSTLLSAMLVGSAVVMVAKP